MLPQTVAAMAGGQRVKAATLFELEFLTATHRYWDGVRYLTTLDDRVWLGAGQLISASGLEHSRGLSAPQATFSLSGVDDFLIQYASGSAQEVTGRPIRVYIQFLTDSFEPLDNPVAIWAGRMDVMSFQAGGDEQSITITAETLFVNRIRAPYAYMTSADQRARWPGDTGMDFMPSLRNKTVTWLTG